jgi:hypothetical protein
MGLQLPESRNSSDSPNERGIIVSDEERVFWLAIRQGLLIMVGAIERKLNMERSVEPRHKRSKAA